MTGSGGCDGLFGRESFFWIEMGRRITFGLLLLTLCVWRLPLMSPFSLRGWLNKKSSGFPGQGHACVVSSDGPFFSELQPEGEPNYTTKM